MPINDSDKDLYSKLYDSKTVEDVISSLEELHTKSLKKALESAIQTACPLEDTLDLIYYRNLVSNQPSGGADVGYRNFVQLKVDIANIKTLLRMGTVE